MIFLEVMELDIDSLVRLGEKMQLSGRDLSDFVGEQKKLAREEQAIERAVRKEAEEGAERKREHERQKLIKERELEHEKAMIEMKLQLREKEGNKASSTSTGRSKMTVPAPRMPPFSAGENLDAYLLRFERFARAQAWEVDDYAPN